MSVIAATKLEIPPRREGLVPRATLVSLLAGADHTRLTMLSAPAGSGKTTLLQQWHLAASATQPFAWLSLEESDDDPVRFWTCVVEALRTIAPDIGARAEGALRSHGVSLEDVVVPLLVNELTALSGRAVLVLDDLHAVADEHIHRSLIALVERLPVTLHLAVATRADPPWPMLPRLRARDQIVEIRAAQMRFNEDEAASYLAALGLELPAARVAEIQQRTEGWAAGLQLAGLSLRTNPATEGFVGARGDDRHIGDYLAAEVLDRVSADERRFLLRTSILHRMSGALCDAVLAGEGSAEHLAELDRRNLFVVALDGRRQWYRYHHLFAELLRARLDVEDPGAAAALHARAATWLAAEGQTAEAIGHAIAAGDRSATAQLVAAHWLTFFNRGWLMTVRRWLDALPSEALAADRRLWLARAWTSMDLGELDEVAAWLERAPEGDEWVGVLRALRLFKLGDVGAASVAVGAAVHGRQSESSFWRTVAPVVTGVSAYWRGRYAEARPALEEAARIASAAGNALAHQYVLGYLALEAAEHDSPDAAIARLSERASGAAGEPQVGEHFTAMMGHLALGRAAELQGRLAESERELARASDLSRRGAGVLERAAASLAHARVLAALGRREAARARLEDARVLLAACTAPGILERALAQAEHAPGLAPPRAPAAASADLSDRELGVLRLLHSELSLREIGAELFLSVNTIKTHTRNIYVKLGADGRDEAVARARELGML